MYSNSFVPSRDSGSLVQFRSNPVEPSLYSLYSCSKNRATPAYPPATPVLLFNSVPNFVEPPPCTKSKSPGTRPGRIAVAISNYCSASN